LRVVDYINDQSNVVVGCSKLVVMMINITLWLSVVGSIDDQFDVVADLLSVVCC
jgi:hypothetical protein